MAQQLLGLLMPEQLNPAELAARKAQEKLEACLAEKKSFRLEAGAGAGKTYSLVEALREIIAARGPELVQKKQRVACITYTTVARAEILQDIDEHPAILVDTIHGFSWSVLSQFQTQLRELIPRIERNTEKILAVGGIGNRRVEYELGFFGIEDERVTLSHDDIPWLMAELLASKKFRRFFTSSFPVLFIDEYQDTDAYFMDSIAKNFLETGEGPQVGLFGDHWQTIYRSEYDLFDFPNLVAIEKGANFRSAPAIVEVLNRLRPELSQAVKDPEEEGEARVFITNDYKGARVSSTHGKDDLPPEVAHQFLEALRKKLEQEGWNFAPEATKILMLTHNVLAAEQGYPNIAKAFNRKESFSKKEDSVIAYLLEIVEPVYRAYEAKRFGEIFRILNSTKSLKGPDDKRAWHKLMDGLADVRAKGTVGDVLDYLSTTEQLRWTDAVVRRHEKLAETGGEPKEDESKSITSLRALRQISYNEVIELSKFIEGSTPFATQHSVKGAQFENVLVVLGGGWNHYNWPQLLELIETKSVTAKNTKAYYRARNLFYVALSRPQKRLAVLVNQALPDVSVKALHTLFGVGNVHSFVI
jgi:DNA helicase-2/ATP-dependent DNA helicase PcrA